MALIIDIQPLEKVLLTTKQTVKCKGNKEKKMAIFELIFFSSRREKAIARAQRFSARLGSNSSLVDSYYILLGGACWRCALNLRVRTAINLY